MSPLVAITGNGAAAEAMRQIDPDVVAAFPITPSTQIVEDFAKFVADGRVGTELVTVESEHSAMSACVGAAVAGGRVMTATSSCGLALMWEMLYVAASMRQPVVMTVVSRALSGPINIHCDHGDIMGCRDAGWVQLFAENNQEAYDNLIMAPRIAEHPDVRLPVMVCMDGFIISHCIETMRLEEDARVRGFVGEFTPVHPLLDTAHPASWGGLDLQDYYIEHKRGQHEAVMNAMSVIRDVSREFAETFGRRYDLFEGYRLDDAERVLVAINSVCGEVKEAVDELRDAGERVGLLKVRVFRPFPYDEIREALKKARIVTVLDRAESFGAYGPLFTEIRAALYDLERRPLVAGRTFGLGGRDLFAGDVKDLFEESRRCLESGAPVKASGYLGVRGE